MKIANDNPASENTGQQFQAGRGYDRLLNIAQVCDMVALSRATIYRLQLSGDFPARIKLSVGTARYLERSVAAWVAGKIASQSLAA